MDYQGILQTRLQGPPYFNQCSDCHSPAPTWCSVNFHVFLCTRCATLHKQYLNNKSQIKSITLDRWSPQEIESFCVLDPQLDSHLIYSFCQTNNVYDLQNLIINKYAKLQPNNQRRLTGNRKATNYELSQFGNEIRLIQNLTQNHFYSIDLIVEALLLSNTNNTNNNNNTIDGAMNLLKDYKEQGSNTTKPPQLPNRPNKQIKSAVFDGTNIISHQHSNSSINSPRPAVFDGTVDLTQQQNAIPQQTGIYQATLPQQTGTYPSPFPQQTGVYPSELPQQQSTYQPTVPQQTGVYQQNSPYPPYYTMANYPPQ